MAWARARQTQLKLIKRATDHNPHNHEYELVHFALSLRQSMSGDLKQKVKKNQKRMLSATVSSKEN
jgi:hypothetical protein